MKDLAHRWGLNGGNDREQHDVYNAGALVDASVHYYRATGKTRLLQVAVKLANQMADVMGPPPKKNVVPGHALGEEAMVKLYALFRQHPELKAQMPVRVDERRYLELGELTLPMPVQRVRAEEKVQADAGRVALQRGPIVYCVEAEDNDGHIRDLVVGPDAPLKSEWRPNLLGGVTIVQGTAQLCEPHASADVALGGRSTEFTAIPYFANSNRQSGAMMVWMAESPDKAQPSTPANRATPSASHCNSTDSLTALNDLIDPATSDDTAIPRFTWWDHRGSKEWVQYDFQRPEKISSTEVYWWDERRIKAHCRVPESWQLLYQAGDEWKPVHSPDAYGTEMDRFNRVTFDPVETKAVRIEVQLQPEWSGGILEWRVK